MLRNVKNLNPRFYFAYFKIVLLFIEGISNLLNLKKTENLF